MRANTALTIITGSLVAALGLAPPCALAAPQEQQRAATARATPAQLDRARRLLADGSLDDAVALLREIIRTDPANSGAHLLLGRALSLVPVPSEAIAALERAVALDPSSADAHHALAIALARFGDSAAARPEFERALELDPALVDARVGLALVLAQQGQHEAARLQVARAIERHGESPAAAYPHYLMAQLLREAGDLEQAREHLAAAIARRPDYAAAYLSLGLVERDRGNARAALEAFEQALRLDPGDAVSRAELGAAYLRDRRAEAALPHLERAVRDRPADRSIRYNLCRALRLAGRSADAARCAREMAEQSRQSAAADIEAGQANNDGVALENAGNLTSALEHYRKAVALDPLNTVFRRNLALALCRMNQWDACVAELDQVLEIDPNDQDAIRALYIAREQAAKTPPR